MKFWTEPDTVHNRVARMAIDGGRHRIFASGSIETDTARLFEAFVSARNIDWAIVYFDSPGGSLKGGIELGEAIRRFSFDTAVGSQIDESGKHKGTCASSAAYAFAGGVNRFFDAYSGRLGVHQYYTDHNYGDFGYAQIISGKIVNYLDRMGVNPSIFSVACAAAGHEMVWLTPTEATTMRLTNNGSQQTTAEIRLTGRNPYLRIEQIHHNVTIRLLLLPGERSVELMAGIVTASDMTAMRYELLQRSYFEFDGREVSSEIGRKGACPNDCVLWIERVVDAELNSALLSSNRMDIWTENGSDFRWGGGIEIESIRGHISAFLQNCTVHEAI